MNLTNIDSLPMAWHNQITLRDLVAGQRLFQPGDSATSLFIVETGRFKLTSLTSENKILTLQLAKSGDILGEDAFISEVYLGTAVAQLASRVIVYPKSLLLSGVREYPNLVEDLLVLLGTKINSFRRTLELRSIRDAHQRVLQYLKYLAANNEQTEEIVARLDQPFKEIAAELDFTPETLSRALTRLEREGAITRQQNEITVHSTAVA